METYKENSIVTLGARLFLTLQNEFFITEKETAIVLFCLFRFAYFKIMDLPKRLATTWMKMDIK